MKTTRTILIVIISVALFNACKKKTLPEPEDGNTPQFYFIGNVNGTNVSLQAGVNNYYMYSSYLQGTNNVYSFGGSLKPQNCVSCYNSISIEINDHKISSYNGPSGIDSAFQSTFYPYINGSPSPVSYYVVFYPLFNNTAQSYKWDFGDGDTSGTPNPSHVFKHSGNYNVSLTIKDASSCLNSVSNIQKIGLSDSYCRTTITVTSTSSLNATFTNSTVGTPPYNFLWDLGDGNFSTMPTPTHTYATQGRYPVSCRVIDAANDTATANLNYITQSSSICATNYLVVGNYGMSNPNALSNITVKWTDGNGVEYSSNNVSQPSTSHFKIISASDYHTNELGQKTKKLHVKFNCVVYNGTNSMQINNGEAVVVVAYQ
jgi:PKD repeat protein